MSGWSRRGFLGALAASGTVGCRSTPEENKEFSIGFMTDTHVGTTRTSCAHVEGAYRIFRREGCEVIVNAGDVADYFYPEGYRHYRAIASETYPDKASAPKEIFVYANHDTLRYPCLPGETKWDAFPHVKKLLEIPHDPWDKITHKGYTFLVVPQSIDLKRYEQFVADACADNPGRRVFLCDHMPGGRTTFGTGIWGDSRRRKILNRHPQIVALTGHTHGSLRDPRQVWQGEYTSVNAGCLQNWGGYYVGISPAAKSEYGVFVIDVYPSRLAFRRYDVRTGQPFEVCARDSVERYRAALWRKQGGEWTSYAMKDVEYPFYDPAALRSFEATVAFAPAYFIPGEPYRIMLTPLDFDGRRGATRIVAEGVAPSAKADGEVVFESRAPMKEMPFVYGLDPGQGKPVAVKDGFYDFTGENARLEIPAAVWKGTKGTRFRYVVELTAEQDDERTWSMTMRNPQPLTNGHGRLFTAPGNPGVQRYVCTFEKAADDFSYYLLFREGLAGRIRFDYFKVEKI